MVEILLIVTYNTIPSSEWMETDITGVYRNQGGTCRDRGHAPPTTSSHSTMAIFHLDSLTDTCSFNNRYVTDRI